MRPRTAHAPASRRARGTGSRTHAARPEHRLVSCSCSTTAALRRALCSVGGLRQELVQRRVEQPDGDRPASTARRISRSRLLKGAQGSDRRHPGRARRRHDGVRHQRWRSPRNMCSVRHSPTPSAPSSIARRTSSGVSAFAAHASTRSSSAHPKHGLEVLRDRGLHQRHVVERDGPWLPSIGDPVAFGAGSARRFSPRRRPGRSSTDAAPVTLGGHSRVPRARRGSPSSLAREDPARGREIRRRHPPR